MANTNWTDSETPQTADWSNPSGISNSPLYDDATISYDDPLIYYDGYDASTITNDDVIFDLWTESNIPSNSAWLGGGIIDAPQYDDATISYDDPLEFYEGYDPSADTLD